jgi:hypothetical protein
MADFQSDRAKIADIDAMISALRNVVKTTRTNLSQSDLVQRWVYERRQTIAKLEREIADLLASQLDGPSLIERSNARILALAQERKMIIHKHKIERLIALQSAMGKLEPTDIDLAEIGASADGESDIDSADDIDDEFDTYESESEDNDE